MSQWKSSFTIGGILFILFCLFFPLSLAYGELTDVQESFLHKHWRKYKTKYNKLLSVPVKEMIKSEPAKKVLDKFGDTLNAIEVMEKLADNKDHEALLKVIEELEKKGLKKAFPTYYKMLTWTSWAKTGMELFKSLVWDPMLIKEQVDTYAAHRLKGMSPEEAIQYPAVEFVQVQDLVKNALAAQYNVKVIYDEQGRILEKWKAKYHETLLAVFELEYNRQFADQIREKMESELEEQLNQMSDELLGSLEQPNLAFEGAVASDLGVLDVGEIKRVEIAYTLSKVVPDQPYLVRERWSLGDKLSQSHQEEKDITSGTYRFGTDLKITPDFEPGEYYLVFQVDVPEHQLSIVSGRISFKVSDFYVKTKKNIETAQGLLLQCKTNEALALAPSAADLDRLARLKDDNSEMGGLYEQAAAAAQEIKAAVEAVSFYYKFKGVVTGQLSACNFEFIDVALQDLHKYAGQAPAACGLQGDVETIAQQVAAVRALYEAARERLEEGKNKEAGCDYAGAVQDYNEAARIGAGLSCGGGRELAGQAKSLAAGAKTKAEAKKRLEKGVAEADKLIKARQRKEAAEKLRLLSQEIDAYQDISCFNDLDSQVQALQAKQQGRLTVKITGKAETGFGQAVDFFSEVMLDGAPVPDPGVYSYLWEATDIQPINGKGARYTYRNPGKKSIRLTVTDAAGNTATAAVTLKVAPALNFSLRADKQPVAVKEKVNLSAAIDYEKEECPCTYQWTAAGVKGVITDKTAWFNSPRPGTHPLTLTLTNRFGQTATATLNIIVKEFKLAVKITGPAEAGLQQPADFFSEVTLDGVKVPNPEAYSYQWVATEINNPWSGKNVRYNYATPGQKTIRLTVTDTGGRTAAATAVLKVAKALNFTITADKSQVLTGEKVNTSSRVDDEKEQCPCKYEWTTANLNKTIPGATAWFSYPKPGTYPVNLKVTNRFQQTATATLKVAVKEKETAKPPVAPSGAASKDLNGRWRADGYPGGGGEVVIIRHSGSSITATKTKGNENVPAGQITWQGTYSANKFTGQGRVAERGFKNPRWVNVQLHITDENHFTISWDGYSTTRFSRIK